MGFGLAALQRLPYELSEVEFKYNNRKLTDGERTVKLIQACDHRRLTYKQETAKNRDAKGRYTGR